MLDLVVIIWTVHQERAHFTESGTLEGFCEDVSPHLFSWTIFAGGAANRPTAKGHQSTGVAAAIIMSLMRAVNVPEDVG